MRKWKSNWRGDIKLDEGMTTSGLYKVNLPSTGSDILQDIPYGLTGDGTINYGNFDRKYRSRPKYPC